ncbi:hypothetical protein [Paraburkholderia solisilvae]|uniref:Uncharacterized protein n=1 Tax=Paraburkholderia solisilvae TaxID=624376 RepID=A0A6J5EJ77_9BURK|nr:hypothetical protein [Paraburkholderia solisilvae]CAB3766558.1 hypothetical protein LMG29739_04859 [Paraburkholderia solisilvae]
MVSSISNQGGNPLGNGIINGVDGFNRLLNTRAISSVGAAFNATGILTPVHFLADSLGYGAMKAMEGLGRALGGKGDIDYHMKDEWGIGGSSCCTTRGDNDPAQRKQDWDGSMSACRARHGMRCDRTQPHEGFDGSHARAASIRMDIEF